MDNEYYIPESIRYALEFNKVKRGGSKMVYLLVKNSVSLSKYFEKRQRENEVWREMIYTK